MDSNSVIDLFYIDYIKAIENPNKIGWNGKVWTAPTLKGYDQNQRGYGIDINKNIAAKKLTEGRSGKWLSEKEANDLMLQHIKYVYNAAQKHILGFNNLSTKRKAALLGMLYRGDSVNANKDTINIMEPDDNKFFSSISSYYKTKGLNERAKNSDNFFLHNKQPNYWNTIPLWSPPMQFKQGGKMNIIDFLKKGSGIHIKKENRGKFTDYCGGKVTDECILKGKNSSNPAIRKRATFAANARKWKHEKGGEIITKAQQGSQLPTAEDAAKRYKNGDFIKEILDNNEGHSVILGVMTNKPFHNQGSIVRKINYRMGIPVDTTYIETPPSLLPVKKVSRVATRYSNLKDNAYAGNLRQLYKTLSNRYKTAMEVMRRKEGGVLKAQLGLGLTLFNDSQNPNAVGGDIVNSYLRNQLMIPYLNKLKEDYEKWKLQMKQQANTLKSSLLDNVVNTGLSFGVDYLKNKFGI